MLNACYSITVAHTQLIGSSLVIMPFSLTVLSLTPPDLPDQPSSLKITDVQSSLKPSPIAATSPLFFNIALASGTKSPLSPATHLQLSYKYLGTGEVFIPNVITGNDLTPGDEPGVWTVQAPALEIPRAKVNTGATTAAELKVHAWKGEKLLGSWSVGTIENLGIVGMKPHRMSTV